MMKSAFPFFGSSLLALALLSSIAPAHAQDEDEFVSAGGVLPAGMVQSLDPADRLAMNLRLLSQNPRDVNALTQAGISAIEVGDPNAAVGFLGRAETLSPSNGRIKAALGSALVQLEKPVDALRFFNEAVAFGVPERDVWKDRGLAYDLSGDPKRAQRDYEQALRNGQDVETTRRMALSLGASGEKERALRMLEPLVRRNDQGAWRAQAFVLAMAGDIRGAERIVEQVMPTGSLSPFLRRLSTLSAADRAKAVNFGTMPADNRYYASAAPVGPARPISNAASTALASVTPPAVTQRFEGSTIDRSRKAEKRRRPGKDQQVALATQQPLTRPAQVPVAPAAVRNPAPGFSEPVQRPETGGTAPTEVAALPDRRVGKRIGPVDAARLPDVMKPGAADQKWVQVAGSSLPPPTDTRPLVRPPVPTTPVVAPAAPVVTAAAPTVAPQPVPVVASLSRVETPAVTPPPTPRVESAPAPVFEVPSVQIAAAPPAILPPAVPAPKPPTAPLTAPAAKVVEVAPSAVRIVEAPVLPAVSPLPVTPPPTQIAATTPPVTASTAAAAAPVAVAALAAPLATVVTPADVTSAVVTQTIQTNPDQQGESVPAKLSGPTSQEAGLITPPGPTESSSTILADLSPTTVTPLSDNHLSPVTPGPAVAAPGAPKPEVLNPEVLGLASVLEGITPEAESRAGPVLSDQEFRRARMVAKRKAEEEALAATGAKAKEEAEAKAKREEEEERKRVAAQNPARVWVQIATGANRGGLPSTWKKIRDTAPDALKGAAAWYAPYKSTNRLLVGPYKGQSEARALINKLSAKGIATTSYTSDAGQEITRLSSR